MEIKKQNENNNNILIIDNMMKKNNYFPEVKELESVSKEIVDKNNFSKIFNLFLSKLKDFDDCLTSYISSNKIDIKNTYCLDFKVKSFLFTHLRDNDKEVKGYLQEIWEKQESDNKKHTYFFLILVDKYITLSGKITEYDKNILYWTILYHDLGKFMQINPLVDEKVDIYGYIYLLI